MSFGGMSGMASRGLGGSRAIGRSQREGGGGYSKSDDERQSKLRALEAQANQKIANQRDEASDAYSVGVGSGGYNPQSGLQRVASAFNPFGSFSTNPNTGATTHGFASPTRMASSLLGGMLFGPGGGILLSKGVHELGQAMNNSPTAVGQRLAGQNASSPSGMIGQMLSQRQQQQGRAPQMMERRGGGDSPQYPPRLTWGA